MNPRFIPTCSACRQRINGSDRRPYMHFCGVPVCEPCVKTANEVKKFKCNSCCYPDLPPLTITPEEAHFELNVDLLNKIQGQAISNCQDHSQPKNQLCASPECTLTEFVCIRCHDSTHRSHNPFVIPESFLPTQELPPPPANYSDLKNTLKQRVTTELQKIEKNCHNLIDSLINEAQQSLRFTLDLNSKTFFEKRPNLVLELGQATHLKIRNKKQSEAELILRNIKKIVDCDAPNSLWNLLNQIVVDSFGVGMKDATSFYESDPKNVEGKSRFLQKECRYVLGLKHGQYSNIKWGGVQEFLESLMDGCRLESVARPPGMQPSPQTA